MKIKKRLDLLVQEQFPDLTRNQIQSFIMQGKVSIDDRVHTKPGTPVLAEAIVKLEHEVPRYVCRAGWKLEHALDHFHIDPEGLIILDAGLSTGGFTDCLLQRGAKRVYGVDVGYGQVHEKIRKDTRVVVMERTNLRHLRELPEKVDLVTLDLSFISVVKVMEAVLAVLKDDGKLIVLIKPQFEAAKHDVGKGGIIRDPEVHDKVVESITQKVRTLGFKLHGVTESPIYGSGGNKEFLAYFSRT